LRLLQSSHCLLGKIILSHYFSPPYILFTILIFALPKETICSQSQIASTVYFSHYLGF